MYLGGRTSSRKLHGKGDTAAAETPGYGGSGGYAGRDGPRIERGARNISRNPLWEAPKPFVARDEKARQKKLADEITNMKQKTLQQTHKTQTVAAGQVFYGDSARQLTTLQKQMQRGTSIQIPGAYFTDAPDGYTDEMFHGLEGATFRFRGDTYAIRNGDIYVMEGVTPSTFTELSALEGWNPFKKIGQVLRKVHSTVTKSVRKVVKSKVGKVVLGVGLAATGVGLVGMAALGAGGIGSGKAVGSYAVKGYGAVKSGVSSIFGGGKATAGFSAGDAAGMAKGAVGMGTQAAGTAASTAASTGGGWFTAAGLQKAASLATTAVGAYSQYQSIQMQKAAAEQAAAAGYAVDPGLVPGDGAGGGYGGGYGGGSETFPAGGLDTSFAPDVPVEPEIPDVTNYASGAAMPLLIIGAGLLLFSFTGSKRRR